MLGLVFGLGIFGYVLWSNRPRAVTRRLEHAMRVYMFHTSMIPLMYCTVLISAKYIYGLLDCLCLFFRIMVLDKGRIVEFNTPHILIKDKKSVFHGMAKDAGLVA